MEEILEEIFATGDEQELQCEGICIEENECEGEIKRVHIIHEDHDWGMFSYCEVAIAIDEERGFNVYDRSQKHANGNPKFTHAGMMLDKDGNRSIFDDVAE